MRLQEKINEDKLREASALVSRHLGLEVAEVAINGSLMRGFSDPNSDVDICFLINRPVSDFVSNRFNSYLDGNMDDRRKKTALLSATISKELGWQVMITLMDMRTLLHGVMNSTPFALMAYEGFASRNTFIEDLFEDIEKDYFSIANVVLRCGEQTQSSLRKYMEVPSSGAEFRQERLFLSTLWSAHRLIAYMAGDRKHCRSIQDLIDINKACYGQEIKDTSISCGFTSEVLGVIKARTERSPFEFPLGVNNTATHYLEVFVKRVIEMATQYLRQNPVTWPGPSKETREVVDLYCALLDREDEKIEKLKESNEKLENATV